MKYRVSVAEIGELNIEKFLRTLGWAQIYDSRGDKYSYVKRLSRDFYPRLHLYVKKYPDNYVFDLHLDQKKASYEGHSAHSGEYEGEMVNNALETIKRALKAKTSSAEIKKPENKDVLNSIGEGDLKRDQEILEGTKKESKLKRLFKRIF
ncbi:MAG TPA: hypothetical protein VJ926_03460 [Patescibacteria group bacterium]|nr:hypothetical protein [Patescibacteria group bacterium]